MLNQTSFTLGADEPFLIITGPCVIESRDHALRMAAHVKAVAEALMADAPVPVRLVFKASFDKANRSSIHSYRGPGLEEGLRILQECGHATELPLLTDIHEPAQAAAAAEVVDILQIPAFLCRQTDILVAAARTGKLVNVKKGQFLSPPETKNIVTKVEESGGACALTERGFSFGYNNLVVDMRGLATMRHYAPVIFDATHSVQQPGGHGTASGGQREFALPLARAAAAVGLDGLFCESHDDPANAKSDGPNQIPIGELEGFLRQVLAFVATERKLGR